MSAKTVNKAVKSELTTAIEKIKFSSPDVKAALLGIAKLEQGFANKKAMGTYRGILMAIGVTYPSDRENIAGLITNANAKPIKKEKQVGKLTSVLPESTKSTGCRSCGNKGRASGPKPLSKASTTLDVVAYFSHNTKDIATRISNIRAYAKAEGINIPATGSVTELSGYVFRELQKQKQADKKAAK